MLRVESEAQLTRSEDAASSRPPCARQRTKPAGSDRPELVRV